LPLGLSDLLVVFGAFSLRLAASTFEGKTLPFGLFSLLVAVGPFCLGIAI